MEAEQEHLDVPVKAPFLTRALDIETGLKHILAPAFFGALVGGLWQWKVMPHIGELNLPNPIHGALFMSILLSPSCTSSLLVMKAHDGKNTPLDFHRLRCFSPSFGFQAGAQSFVVDTVLYWYGSG